MSTIYCRDNFRLNLCNLNFVIYPTGSVVGFDGFKTDIPLLLGQEWVPDRII